MRREIGKAQKMAMKDFQKNQIMETNAISKRVTLTKLPQSFTFCNILHIRVSIHKPGEKSHRLKPVQIKWKYRNTSMEETVWKAE